MIFMCNDVGLCEILRYYITSELSKDYKNISENINNMDKDDLCKKVKCLSEKRKNEMYNKLCCNKYKWIKMTASYERLQLSKINDKINKYLDKAKFMLKPFAELVKKLDFCSLMNEFQPKNIIIKYNVLICLKENNNIRIIDGNHRAVALFILGTRNFNCYVGYK